MYGIFLNGDRPASKKAVKEAAMGTEVASVRLEATSIFGDEYSGMLTGAPDGTYTFVGPDPYTKRNFYGNIVVKGGKVKVS